MFRPLIWAILLLSGRVLAAVSFTNSEYYILEGQPFTITWSGNRGTVTVTLMKGPDANLEQVLVIVTGYAGQEYTWTPPPTLAHDSYELQVEDAGSTDYSPRFQYPAPPLPSSTSNADSSGIPSATIPSSTSTTPPSDVTLSPSPSAGAGAGTETLPTTAKAAIAALGGLLGIAILVFVVYCVRRRRRKRAEREAAAAAAAFEASYELPLSTVETHVWSPATTASMHMKTYGSMHGRQQQGQQDSVELPVRGWAEMSELSAEGRHLR